MTTQDASTTTRSRAGQDATRFLRTTLRVDAGACTVLGLAMAAGAGPLHGQLGLPVALLVPFGIVLLVGGIAALAHLARTAGPPRTMASGASVLNVLSIAGCIALVFTDLVSLTSLGVAFLLAGATAMAVLTELYVIGLRRLPR